MAAPLLLPLGSLVWATAHDLPPWPAQVHSNCTSLGVTADPGTHAEVRRLNASNDNHQHLCIVPKTAIHPFVRDAFHDHQLRRSGPYHGAVEEAAGIAWGLMKHAVATVSPSDAHMVTIASAPSVPPHDHNADEIEQGLLARRAAAPTLLPKPLPQGTPPQVPVEELDNKSDESKQPTEDIVFAVGSVLWAQLEGFPWWPARVVLEEEVDFASLRVASIADNQTLVLFFNDRNRFCLIEKSRTHPFRLDSFYKARRAQRGKYSRDIISAINDAWAFIDSMHSSATLSMWQPPIPDPDRVLVNAKPRSTKRRKPSATADPLLVPKRRKSDAKISNPAPRPTTAGKSPILPSPKVALASLPIPHTPLSTKSPTSKTSITPPAPKSQIPTFGKSPIRPLDKSTISPSYKPYILPTSQTPIALPRKPNIPSPRKRFAPVRKAPVLISVKGPIDHSRKLTVIPSTGAPIVLPGKLPVVPAEKPVIQPPERPGMRPSLSTALPTLSTVIAAEKEIVLRTGNSPYLIPHKLQTVPHRAEPITAPTANPPKPPSLPGGEGEWRGEYRGGDPYAPVSDFPHGKSLPKHLLQKLSHVYVPLTSTAKSLPHGLREVSKQPVLKPLASANASLPGHEVEPVSVRCVTQAGSSGDYCDGDPYLDDGGYSKGSASGSVHGPKPTMQLPRHPQKSVSTPTLRKPFRKAITESIRNSTTLAALRPSMPISLQKTGKDNQPLVQNVTLVKGKTIVESRKNAKVTKQSLSQPKISSADAITGLAKSGPVVVKRCRRPVTSVLAESEGSYHDGNDDFSTVQVLSKSARVDEPLQSRHIRPLSRQFTASERPVITTGMPLEPKNTASGIRMTGPKALQASQRPIFHSAHGMKAGQSVLAAASIDKCQSVPVHGLSGKENETAEMATKDTLDDDGGKGDDRRASCDLSISEIEDMSTSDKSGDNKMHVVIQVVKPQKGNGQSTSTDGMKVFPKRPESVALPCSEASRSVKPTHSNTPSVIDLTRSVTDDRGASESRPELRKHGDNLSSSRGGSDGKQRAGQLEGTSGRDEDEGAKTDENGKGRLQTDAANTRAEVATLNVDPCGDEDGKIGGDLGDGTNENCNENGSGAAPGGEGSDNTKRRRQIERTEEMKSLSIVKKCISHISRCEDEVENDAEGATSTGNIQQKASTAGNHNHKCEGRIHRDDGNDVCNCGLNSNAKATKQMETNKATGASCVPAAGEDHVDEVPEENSRIGNNTCTTCNCERRDKLREERRAVKKKRRREKRKALVKALGQVVQSLLDAYEDSDDDEDE